MTAINHALTGALTGAVVSNPFMAVPLSLLSHFILDVLPHYGSSQSDEVYLKSKRFTTLLAVDALMCLALVLIIAVQHPLNWLLMVVCAFVAAAPDFAWLPGYVRAKKGISKSWHTNWFTTFAARIQWFERPIGGVVEIAWFVGISALLIAYL